MIVIDRNSEFYILKFILSGTENPEFGISGWYSETANAQAYSTFFASLS